MHLAEEFLSKWKKIHTDRFGEILLKGDKKFYISNHLVRYSLTNCGDEMFFNDYYNMMEDILIKNEHNDAFKVYARLYQDGTLYDFLRNKYLSLRASH